MVPPQAPGSRSLVLAVAALVATTGCMAAVGDNAKDALGVEDPGGADADEDGGSEELGSGGSAGTYESAFEALDESEEIQRWNMSMRAENASATTTAALLVDAETPLFVASIGSSGDAGMFTSESEEPLLVAQVGKTSLFGSPEGVFGFYNESAEPPHEDLESDAGQGPSKAPTMSTGNTSGPADLLEAFQDLPDDVTVDQEEATVRGEPGSRIHLVGENETVEINMTVTLLEDPLRPATMEGTFLNETPGSEYSERTHIEGTFHYGPAAEHPHEQALVRAEAMTIAREDEVTSLGNAEDEGNTTTRTVQPSINPGLVPLSEVQVLAGSSGVAGSGDEGPALTLDAEEGTVEDEDARLAYADVDGDGHVSPGDEIRLVAKSENGSDYTMALKDEETGMHTMPGPGAALLVALAGVAALARRRRG